jgi:hypothetical protein
LLVLGLEELVLVQPHPPVRPPLHLHPVLVDYALRILVLHIDKSVFKDAPFKVLVDLGLQEQVPRRQRVLEDFKVDGGLAAEVIAIGYREVLVRSQGAVAEVDGPAELELDVVVLVDLDSYDLCRYVGAIVFGVWIPS